MGAIAPIFVFAKNTAPTMQRRQKGVISMIDLFIAYIYMKIIVSIAAAVAVIMIIYTHNKANK